MDQYRPGRRIEINTKKYRGVYHHMGGKRDGRAEEERKEEGPRMQAGEQHRRLIIKAAGGVGGLIGYLQSLYDDALT